jgi:predicted DNA binding protein
VNLYVIHENCWSKYYQTPDLVEILNLIPYPEMDVLRVFLTVSERGYKEIVKLKSEGKIRNIYNVYRQGNKIFVDLIRNYDSTVFSIITSNNGVILNTMKYNGEEIWSFLAYDYKINKILKSLSEIAEIEQVSINDKLPLNILSDREYKILSLAYEIGYFDYPKRIKAKELASILGIRKSTLIYHLRNAERKIIGYFLKSNIKKINE